MPHEFANVLKLRILGNFKKILEVPGIKGWCPAGHLKSKLWQLCHKIEKKNRKKTNKKRRSKTYQIKGYFINFKNLATIFCPGMEVFLLTSLKVQYVTPDILIKIYNAEFHNYHKIAVRDYVHVSNFWSTWHTWANTKEDISRVIAFT